MISLLRAVNLGPHNKVGMQALRELYEVLGLRSVQTYVLSGNVVFGTEAQDAVRLRARLEAAIERSFGFRTDVVLRTTAEMREVIRRNPFAKRAGIEPAKLLVHFLAGAPPAEARRNLAQRKPGPEELRLDGQSLYIYYAEGVGRSKLTAAVLEKMLATPGTARNWNTVTKLLAMAETLEEGW